MTAEAEDNNKQAEGPKLTLLWHICLFTSFALCILMQNMYGFFQKKPNMSARCRPIVEEKVL